MNNNEKNTGSTLRVPHAGRRRKWGRVDLPVIRPGMSPAKVARKLV
jgi:hypothetical protein